SLDISDVDLAAIGASFNELAIGNANAGTGTVTIGSIGSQQGAGNSQLVTNTRIYGGTINIVQAIDSAADTGYLQMIARTGNINPPIFAGDEPRLYRATTVTEGANGYVSVPRLAVLSNGAITMTHASNNSSTVAMNSTDHAIDFRNDPAFLISSVGGIDGLSS